MKCVLCNREIKGYGHDPRPLARNGKCCDKCNVKVIMKRLEMAVAEGGAK